MSTKDKILNYFRLLRFHSGASTPLPPIIASLLQGQKNIYSLAIIFLIGILCHIYGFVLNEYADLKVDKKASYLKNKPLVSGVIPKEHALYISMTACVFALILTIIFFPNPLTILILLTSIILSGLYDIFGKKITGSDFILAGGFFFFCLFGASTVSTNFTNLVYILCVLSFLDILYFNAVSGGIKDVDHDYLAGARTLATVMGAKVKNGVLFVTKKFEAFGYSIKIAYIGLIIYLGSLPDNKIWLTDNYILQIVLILLIFTIFISIYKMFKISTFDRSKLKRILAVHEISTYVIVPVVFLPFIGIETTLVLIFFPFTWFVTMNYVLYGTLVQPQV